MPVCISHLPNELLLIITEYAITGDGDVVAAGLKNLATMTEIASFWRNAVIGCTQFWASIYVHASKPLMSRHRLVDEGIMQFTTKDFARVRYFLHRSRRSPLHIYIKYSWMGLGLLEEHLRATLNADWKSMQDLLAPHMGRCRSISIELLGERKLVDPLDILRSCETPLLQELALVNHYSGPRSVQDPSDSSTRGWTFLPDQIPLKTLRFSDLSEYLPKHIDIQWPHVAVLDLNVREQFWPNVRSSLAHLPTLRDLKIRLVPTTARGDRLFASEGDDLSLPLLERVSTNNPNIWHDITTPSIYWATFAARITLPLPRNEFMLARMQERNLPSVAELPLGKLAQLPLRDITFLGRPVLEALVLPMLQVFTQVEILRFVDCHYHGRLLTRVAQLRGGEDAQLLSHAPGPGPHSRKTGQPILPSLKKIYIEERKSYYRIFWDFPNLWPQPPYSFGYLNQSSLSTDVGLRNLQCDGCRLLKLRCDSGSKLGARCAHCEPRSLDCRFETHPAVTEALETQLAVEHLRSLGFDVAWVLQ
ncbi:hypothetical protein DL93DRAFT_1095343 [Clavulina sp. PMI_390]|nr:hypothetical protein DL93DRAFT_1095343 [Clavulina sp. PMI_390]